MYHDYPSSLLHLKQSQISCVWQKLNPPDRSSSTLATEFLTFFELHLYIHIYQLTFSLSFICLRKSKDWISILIDLIIENVSHVINKAATIILNQITLSVKYTRSTASKRFIRLSIRSKCNLQITDILIKKQKEKSLFSIYIYMYINWQITNFILTRTFDYMYVFYLTDKIISTQE
jgi:hypothetical protein